MIALMRVATFDVLPPIAVMMSITGTFYLIGVAVFGRLSNEVGITSPRELSLLFAAYPFVGLTYRVYPVADGVAIGSCCCACFMIAESGGCPARCFSG
jgi:hypothetical protein